MELNAAARLRKVTVTPALIKELKRKYSKITDKDLSCGDWADDHLDEVYDDGIALGVDLKATPEPFRASICAIGEAIGNRAMIDY